MPIDLWALNHMKVGALLLALGNAIASDAQQARDSVPVLSGVVTMANGRPVERAEVALIGLGATLTDSAGFFGFRGVPAGTFLVRVQRLGLRPIMQAVTFDGVSSVRLALRFGEANVMLAPVVVRETARDLGDASGFERRRSTEQGLYLTEQDIAKRHAGRVEHLLASLPGLEVDTAGVPRIDRGRTSIYGDNCKEGVQIFLNGVAVGSEFSLRSLSAEDLRGIEVYRGVASTPVELRSARVACGTVAIWTK